MRYWALDFIQCINCKNYPLKLIPIETVEQEVDTKGLEFPLCKNYCGFLGEKIVYGKNYPCSKCMRIGIKTGILYCPKCKHWYPIRNGILYMLKDSKRKKESDKEFLRKYRDKIPREILLEGKPYNLAEELKDTEK